VSVKADLIVWEKKKAEMGQVPSRKQFAAL
jgi:hypothetical protein